MSGAAPNGLTSYSRHGLHRSVATASEHEVIEIPEGLLLSGSNIDLYDEVLSLGLFKILVRGTRVVLQAGTYVGLIPLNDRLSIEVRTRVPVSNLERMLSVGNEYGQRTLPFESAYESASEMPTSIVDVIASELVRAVDGLKRESLFRSYERVTREGSDISGRVFPLQSLVRRKQTGRAAAVFSRFDRTANNAVNSCIRTAIDLLLELYGSLRNRTGGRALLSRLAKAQGFFDGVAPDRSLGFLRDSYVANPRHLPDNRPYLSQALATSLLVVQNWGVSIRKRGDTKLPAIAINMEDVFEAYVRKTMALACEKLPDYQVLNGNKGRPVGAKGVIFDPKSIGKYGNSTASPDTVIEVGGKPTLIIETKYKPQKGMPIRDEIDQVISYGVAYGCRNVVLAYPCTDGVGETIVLGKVVGLTIWMTTIALGAPSLADSERVFAERMLEISNCA